MMIMKLSSCLGAVMMPRVSNLIAENKNTEFKHLIQKSYDFTLAISFPLVVLLLFCAPTIVYSLCGKEFSPAILTSQIIAPIILMVGVSNVMGIQVLYPKGKINVVIMCCLIGAIVDLFFNIALIPIFSYNGTAVAYLLAEVATTVSMYFMGRKYIPITYIKKNHLHYLAGGILMSIALYAIGRLNLPILAILIMQGCCGILLYLVFLLLCKDVLIMQVLSKYRK